MKTDSSRFQTQTGRTRTRITAIAASILLSAVLACDLSQPAESSEASSSAQLAEPNNTTSGTWKDLAYANASTAEKLDLATPAGAGPFPTIVYIHGGGFRMGDKREPFMRGIVEELRNNGYAIASLNYRLSGEAIFPAQIEDVKTAVRWLRAHSGEYNLDVDRFGTWGSSAGASLASLLGTSCGVPELEGADLGNAEQPSCVSAVVDFYGPIDFLQMDQEFSGTACAATHDKANSAESQYVGGAIQEHKDVVEQANAITYITSDDPPFFIQHGTQDCTVPFQQSQLFYDALKQGIGEQNLSLQFIEGADHGDQKFYEPANLQLVVDFLDTVLK